MRSLVTGAGGFIGHHLVSRLKFRGDVVVGIDVKYPEFEETFADEFITMTIGEPQYREKLARAMRGVDVVYALAADMGGMGYISTNHWNIITRNIATDLDTIRCAVAAGVPRMFYASSACVYPRGKQQDGAAPLVEEDAYPADPEDAYGWEKLTGEKLCTYASAEHHIATRVARFHNVYGPMGTWRGGREKAPAALCRKVAVAKLAKSRGISVWGDGGQRRSFMHVSDCVEGIVRIAGSEYAAPLNLGTDFDVSIDQVALMVMDVADYHCDIRHVPGPQGVRHRNSNNARLRDVLGWDPEVSLRDGLRETYSWVEGQVMRAKVGEAANREAGYAEEYTGIDAEHEFYPNQVDR